MVDPLPSGPRPAEAPTGAGDDVRIEQLLVTGLDHYFAEEFEQAINVWTRVLFLDRSHDRARAYIDRARSAQAERQRASEALVHQGLAAFDRGEVARARELLSDALDQGASHDLALGVLGRIDRLDMGPGRVAGTVPGEGRRRRRLVSSLVAGRPRGELTRPARRCWMAAAVVLAGVTGLAAWFVASPSPSSLWPPALGPETIVALPAASAPLPVPAPTEVYISQGRELFAAGKLRDALLALDRVPVGDALRPEAERLRGLIQRELLATSVPGAPAPAPSVPQTAPPNE